MKKIVWGVLCLILLANAKVYVREYTYNAGENDSKVTARKAALRQLQLLLIEEVGVTVRSRYFKSQRLQNNVVSKTIDARYESFSQAITKTKILNESWDGETFYLKAEMDIDPKGVATAIDEIQHPQKKIMQLCKTKEEQIKLMLKDLSSSEKIDAIVFESIKEPFILPCNAWHFDIIYKFIHYDSYPQQYTEFLLHELEGIAFPAEDNRVFYIVDYLNKDKGISPREWKVVLLALKKMTASKLRGLLATIFSVPKVTSKAYIDEFFALAKEGKVGLPKALAFTKVLEKTLDAIDKQENELFEYYYDKYKTLFDEKEDRRLYMSLQSRYFKGPTKKRLEMMIEYFNRQKPSKYLSDNLFDILKRLEREGKRDPLFITAFDHFVEKSHKAMIQSFPLCPYASGQQDRISFMLRFDIDSSMTPTPKESAEKLFSKVDTEQLIHARYLVVMGEKARSVEKLIIKRLRRLDRERSNQTTSMKHALIDVLGLIQTHNSEAIELLIKALNSQDYRVPDHAVTALGQLGLDAFEALKSAYGGQETSIQIRIIKVLGIMKQRLPEALVFLRSLNAPEGWIKDALEDALEV